MDTCALDPAKPASDRSVHRIARGAFELGELYLSRSRLRAPRWRLHALLALIAAARNLGLSTRAMESEVRSCLDLLLAGRRGGAFGELEPIVREQLQTWLGEPGVCRGESLQELAASLSALRHLAPFHCARVLLATGHVQQARTLAAEWSDPVLRRRLERLTATGLWGHGDDRRFVAQPFDDDFPPSLPRLIAMTDASRPGTPLTGRQWTRAQNLLARLKPADRQRALAHLATAAYHAGGFAAGARTARAIRYRGCRQLAWLGLLSASLASGRLDNADRAFERLAGGAFRERGRLLFARELIRRGRRRRARRLLDEPFMMPRRSEQALLMCEIEPERIEHTWPRWRDAASRSSEDLARFVPGLASLEHRWTILALHAALEYGLPEDDRDSVIRTLWIPGRCFRALAYDRAAVRCWLRQVEAGAHDLSSVLRVVRWLALDAVEPIWSEHLSLRASRLSRAAGERTPRRLAEAFARGLYAAAGVPAAGVSKIGVPAADRRAISAERCAQDEGISFSPHAGRRRRVVLGAVKHCLKTWLVDGSEPQPGALGSRLRTLSNLGGSLAVDHLARVLKSVRRPTAAYRRAFAVLTSLAPERAARLIFGSHLGLMLEHPPLAREMLLELEYHGALEPGLNCPWDRFIARIRRRLDPRRGAVWLRQLIAAWPGAPRTMPTFAAVDCCSAELEERWPATGDELITRVRRRIDALRNTPTSRLPAALLEDPIALKRLLWLRPPASTGRPVSESDWRSDLKMLRDDLGDVDIPAVLQLARRLAPRRARPLARRLLAGGHPLPDASRVVGLPGKANGAPHRLRYLDKREDLFTFLRLADCVPCCFNSASSWYRADGTRWWVLSLWKDPLSFCFHVERRDADGDWRPCGFVFGGYSLGDNDPAVLLNGIYLRRQDGRLRAAILRAIEETFCRPLGILRIAVANCYRGYGELPSGYVERPATIYRPRALRSKAGPVSAVYDDISGRVNQTLSLSHLYWRVVASS